MSAIRYLKGIHEKFGHHATWLPDEKLGLGDIGIIQNGRFFVRTSLKDLRINAVCRDGASGHWEHSSGSDVQVRFGTGDTPIHNSASFTFGAIGAFLFQSDGCQTHTIENMDSVGDELLIALRANVIPKNYILIDRLITADAVTILIANSRTASISVSASSGIPSLRAISDASIGLNVIDWKGELTRLSRQRNSPRCLERLDSIGIFFPTQPLTRYGSKNRTQTLNLLSISNLTKS